MLKSWIVFFQVGPSNWKSTSEKTAVKSLELNFLSESSQDLLSPSPCVLSQRKQILKALLPVDYCFYEYNWQLFFFKIHYRHEFQNFRECFRLCQLEHYWFFRVKSERTDKWKRATWQNKMLLTCRSYSKLQTQFLIGSPCQRVTGTKQIGQQSDAYHLHYRHVSAISRTPITFSYSLLSSCFRWWISQVLLPTACTAKNSSTLCSNGQSVNSARDTNQSA